MWISGFDEEERRLAMPFAGFDEEERRLAMSFAGFDEPTRAHPSFSTALSNSIARG